MYVDQSLLLPESSFLDRFTDAAWEAVRDAPSEEAYARHTHLNNALLDLKSGAVKTTREIKPGDPLLLIQRLGRFIKPDKAPRGRVGQSSLESERR